jgi:hypothetical protein
MKYLNVLLILLFLVACAAQEPESTRESSKQITIDDYEDLKIKKRRTEPNLVDYKEGSYGQNFENLRPPSEEQKPQKETQEGTDFDQSSEEINPFE